MAANAAPIFSRVGDVTTNASTGMAQAITAAAADFTGAGASNVLVWTADPTNGGFIQRLIFKAAGTNVASVARIFINNGTANTTATNNTFVGEIALPATTLNNAGITGPDISYQLNYAIPPGFKIYVGLGTAVAAGWFVTPIAGKY